MKERNKRKNNIKEIFWYGISGVTTAAVNIGFYYLLISIGTDFRIANLIAIISSKVYAYFTNKYLVFRTRCNTYRKALVEFIKFLFARGFTGLIDFIGVWFAVDYLSVDRMVSKYAIQVIVIILNYILGRVFVFTRDKRPHSS